MSNTAVPTRQTLANRRNAQLSTGPKTPEGKAASSRNAVKTGLTGRTVLLPCDDVEAYEHHLQRFATQFQPSGERETELVQAIADAQWRLNRIPVLEAGIYAVGSVEMADLFPEETPAVRALLIQSRTYLVYSRQLKNLHLQESRLRRQYDNDMAELRKLQRDRKFDELFEMASNLRPASKPKTTKAQPAAPPVAPVLDRPAEAPVTANKPQQSSESRPIGK